MSISIVMPSKKTPKYFVPAAAKTLQILEALAAFDKPATLQGLIEYTGLPKSSIYVILATLETLRYVERDAANTFRLGPKAIQFGAAATQSANLSQLFHQAARKIVEECGETVQLAILDQTEVIYVAREDGTRQVQLVSRIGRRLPAHATGLGKAMLATLPDESFNSLFAHRQLTTLTPHTITSVSQLKGELNLVRERGYAHDNQESAEGLQCLAAPIYDHTGQAIAAISVSFLSARATPEHFHCILTSVKSAAQEISTGMGWRAPIAKKQTNSSTTNSII
jgi:DNA-binding IclR family transcriptional regulator